MPSTDEQIDASSQDTIERLIKAVRVHFESTILNRALITQKWKLYLDSFPICDHIDIPLPPLQSSGLSFKYTDSGGTETTMTVTTDYLVDTVSEPGRIVLPYNGIWPLTELYPVNPIVIEYQCGYGLTPEDVPSEIRQAMLIMIADLYDNREDLVEKAMSNLKTVDRLLSGYRIIPV